MRFVVLTHLMENHLIATLSQGNTPTGISTVVLELLPAISQELPQTVADALTGMNKDWMCQHIHIPLNATTPMTTG